MDEIWEDIKDFPDYMVSNFGDVYSWKTHRILKPWPTKGGYLQLDLCDDGRVYPRVIHQLVAEVFVPGWDEGLEPNHIDGDKTNNAESNLEWVTKSENMRHSYDLGLNPIRRAIEVIETGETFPSIAECARQLDLKPSSISSVLSGYRKQLKRYRFRYAS